MLGNFPIAESFRHQTQNLVFAFTEFVYFNGGSSRSEAPFRLAEEVEYLMRDRYDIGLNEEDTFTVISQDNLLDVVGQITDILTLFDLLGANLMGLAYPYLPDAFSGKNTLQLCHELLFSEWFAYENRIHATD